MSLTENVSSFLIDYLLLANGPLLKHQLGYKWMKILKYFYMEDTGTFL